MAKPGRAVSTLVLAFVILNVIETTSSQGSCPYPSCTGNPPPASTGNPASPSAVMTTPTQEGAYPAPPGTIYPPPAGYFPYSPPQPSGGFYGAPPPPDPILPYFPYYYRKPPRMKTAESSAAGLRISTVVLIGAVASLGQLWYII
ncbi:WW domain-binding protein 2 [Eucalyptus grandis]|uniref:Uncharacterized protein n=2 Tax=Eucalyptus grandis TaxID=71139 RepID=A0ACC3K6K5_EUCGR|nr:WW domain-binding protein 2 [Eucalyptus grandis]KAK3421556.1 hypothetical protein EUGRSUZ_G02190 [Eucalyptus grandis]